MAFSTPLRRSAAAVAVLSAAALAAACADSPVEPTLRPSSPLLHVAPLDTPYTSTVCKVGPAGSYQFALSVWPDRIVAPTNVSGTLLVPVPFDLSAGQCVDVFRGGALLDGIYASEVNLPAGTALEKIVVQLKGGDCAVLAEFCPVTFTGANQVYVEVFQGKGYVITFYNKSTTPPPPPPVGGHGCTPGFWKNSPASWGPTGYSPNNDFDTIFGVNAFNPNISLIGALNLGNGGKDALARHATAALLNAAHPSVGYNLTPSQVISMVQAAFAPGGDIEGTKNKFEAFNEQGCPLANDNSFSK
ncbi:MAG TPA: hypothetical protein VKA84_22890 [Gemmatimonadaceae bacterium]|nr:hypothetical protein [Gemmatimonadaceae bacterium]